MRVDVGGYAYIIRKLPIVTTYEQQQERKERVRRILQKVLMIIILICVCIVAGIVSLELVVPMTAVCLFGIFAVVTDHVAIF